VNGWVPLSAAATAAGRSRRTVQTWVRRGVVAGACRLSDRAAMVWLPDLMAATWRAERRGAERGCLTDRAAS
jgi:hypothetical protein